jgi:Spy/CpxP family protein refolding chaperone
MYRAIVKLVDYGNLTEEQRAKLRKLLEARRVELEKALSEVEDGLSQLRPAGKKRKTGKKRPAKRR